MPWGVEAAPGCGMPLEEEGGGLGPGGAVLIGGERVGARKLDRVVNNVGGTQAKVWM